MKKYIKGEHNILITVSGRKSSPRPKGCKISLTFSSVEMIPPAVYLTNLLRGRFGTQVFPGGDLKQETPRSEVKNKNYYKLKSTSPSRLTAAHFNNIPYDYSHS
jgi:hypothetical protein